MERMLCNWMSICLYQFLKVNNFARNRISEVVFWLLRLTNVSLQDSAGEPLYKLFKAIKHQVEKGPVDAKMKKAKYTLNDTGLLGDDVEYSILVSTFFYQEISHFQ